MSFSIGDKVIFINESREGCVVKIKDINTLVIHSDGIDVDVSTNDVIKITKETESFYQKARESIIHLKEGLCNFKRIPKKTPPSIKDFKIDISKNFELDLHIEKIIENFNYLSNREILEIQMDMFFKGLFEASRLNLDYIIVIHGVGKGVLKGKILSFLKDNNASFTEENKIIYQGGATRIKLR